MFKPVSSRVSFPKMEEEVLRWWQENHIFERSVESRRGGPRFTLYEGPPTANGNPGIHHVLARVFKDIIPRYKTMKGYYAPRKAGWDTHGLPVELEVEKQLGFSGKPQIEAYGIAKFNEKCRQSVFKYLKEWNSMTERIGFWVDLEHPYITMERGYIETVWWAIKQLWERGLVYQGYRVTPHCPRCGTSLSSHEVALGYKEDTEDPSVFIKFKTYLSTGKESDISNKLFNLARTKDTFFLAWTTTPWTLPGNTALAISPEAEYAVVEVGNEYLILADALREKVRLGDCKVAMRVKGSYLEHAEYEPLFNPHRFEVQRLKPQSYVDRGIRRMTTIFEAQSPDQNLTYKVIEADFVSLDEGTGIVHVAPAFGEVDFEAGLYHDLNFVQPVDLQGKITGTYPFAGKFVKEADPMVLENLKQRNLLFRAEKIRHTYPFCWRCGTPLLYYAKETWYIKTTAIKDKLISGNDEISWYPEHIKHGRFGDWLRNNVDWAFSRERYWGTPLPIWKCEQCGGFECIGGFAELKARPGLKGYSDGLDPHRPYVDEVAFACAKCGSTMKRIPEVIDCWFDSGAMPVAQDHYPFENATLLEDGRYPADYICEAVDQTRGWFYSLHAISELLFGRICYRNVICLGHILDAEGEKMSKARGNVVDPWSVINKYGADALRWYFYTSSPPGNVRRFSADNVAEVGRSFFTTFWNVYSFFVMYANIDNYRPTNPEPPGAPGAELDRWILSELNQLVLDVDSYLENYNPTDAGRRLQDFVDYLSNWYVRRSRRRFWKSENDADKSSAYNTLYRCLVTMAKLIAPFTPFLADEMYRNLVSAVFPDAPSSVHLADFPVADKSQIAPQLSEDMRLTMKVCSLGRAVRSGAGIKVRQPLSKIVVKVAGARQQSALQRAAPQVLEEVNVKVLDIVQELTAPAMPSITEGDLTVAVDTTVTSELAGEGMAREIVHRLQGMRRAAGFEIANHIVTYYEGSDYVRQVMADFAGYIKQETLSDSLAPGVPADGTHRETFKLGEHSLTLGVRKVG